MTLSPLRLGVAAVRAHLALALQKVSGGEEDGNVASIVHVEAKIEIELEVEVEVRVAEPPSPLLTTSTVNTSTQMLQVTRSYLYHVL